MNKQDYDEKLFEMLKKWVKRMQILKEIRLQKLKNC